MSEWRARMSRVRALLKTALGKQAGFFIQYDFANTVERLEFYPAFAKKCAQADLDPILAMLDSEPVRTDPLFRDRTGHLDTLDALIDYAMVRWSKPQRIVEIGSGRSTHILNRAVTDNGTGQIECIDPAPRLDIAELPVKLHRRVLTKDDVDIVLSLEANDILFIDSSHILQPGTDCDIEFNIMFPELKSGVIVHVHDIFLPFAYPPKWKDRNWNEACGLAPWVLSDAFEVLFPTYYATQERHDELYQAMPDYTRRGPYAGGSFWMRKR
ncbi:class I SAM-dependent methyltransferase [Erythrobacter sp.]|uniref:class I SAM-dependent methyltransferase n=1 Tax=Erythrobacter sp. TaxID=1042 RepID=UPI001425BD75|nr:class I SAM-dependent methyltransferase [Erythrobacter sp.]QIQ85665.1 MAG: class I SAM-dependent methyltransferase [Erythrobacter sp.]